MLPSLLVSTRASTLHLISLKAFENLFACVFLFWLCWTLLKHLAWVPNWFTSECKVFYVAFIFPHSISASFYLHSLILNVLNTIQAFGLSTKLDLTFHDPFMTLSWPFHDSYVTLSWPLHDLFMILTWPFDDPVMILSWPFDDPHMTLSLPLHDFYMTLSRPLRDSYMASFRKLSRLFCSAFITFSLLWLHWRLHWEVIKESRARWEYGDVSVLQQSCFGLRMNAIWDETIFIWHHADDFCCAWKVDHWLWLKEWILAVIATMINRLIYPQTTMNLTIVSPESVSD